MLALTVPQTSVVCDVEGYSVVANTLSLVFGPGALTRTVPAGNKTAFVVSFVYADAAPGFGALTTPKQATAFTLGRGVNANAWGIAKGVNQQNPSWSLTPPSGLPIIGSGVQSTVQFTISGIETEFQPGPTLMFVSYSGVPGYQDGSFTVLLTKVPHVQITSFTATPPVSTLGPDGKAAVALDWGVSDAGLLTLSPYQPITNPNGINVSIKTTTTFTLSAQGLALANLGNVAYRNVTATVMPVVNSFLASPAAIAQTDFPTGVNLSWNVNSNDNVTLVSSVTGTDPTQYGPQALTVPKTLQSPQMLTLVPTNALGPWQNRSVIIPAYQIQTQSVNMGSISAAAASPSAGIVAVSNSSSNTVTFVSSLSYQVVGSPVSVGSRPVALAFSPDGTLLYVANGGDGSVSVIQISASQSAMPYTYSVVATVTLGGSPQQIAVSPDGSTIFVTIDNGANPGSVSILTKSGLSFTTTSLPVGNAPRGVVVTLSGAQVFVANSADNTISMLGITNSGYANAGTILNVGSKPTGLALSTDGATVLATSAGGNAVIAISVQYPFTSQQPPIPVGNNPQAIAVLPTGGYALVTNFGDGTVSVLRYSGVPAVVATTPVGLGPTAVTVAPHSGIAFVCNQTGGNLGVLTLASYVQETAPLSCNGAVTKVAVAPAGGQAIAWYDALFSLQDRLQQPATGLWVYSASGTIANQMTGTAIFDLAYSPGSGDGFAYAIVAKQSSVTIVDTTTFATTTTVAIPDKGSFTGRLPLRVKVSADGSTVFALVSDGAGQMSMVVMTANAGARTFSIAADVVLFSGGSATLLEVMPDGSAAFAIGFGGVWVLQRQQDGGYQVNVAPISLPPTPTASTILPDGSKLYIVTKHMFSTIMVTIDTTTLAAASTYLIESVMQVSINGITALPDGSRLLATDGMTAGIRVFDAATLLSVQTITWNSAVLGPYGIASAPDGSRIFVANQNSGNLGIIDQIQPA